MLRTMNAHQQLRQDDEQAQRRTRRRIRAMFLFTVVGAFIAAAWDGYWHVTREFDGFFSPPHVMAYSVAMISAVLVNQTLLSRRWRGQLGPGFRIPVLPFEVPGSLFILGAGLVMLGFAGLVLDNIWHTLFGLSETGWSFPHAMIGWALIITILGYTSTWLASGGMHWFWKLLIGWLVLIMVGGVIMGPIGKFQTNDVALAYSRIPVNLSQEATRTLFDVYLTHNLNRTNPFILLLAPLGAAAGLAFTRRLSGSAVVFLVVALLASGDDQGSLQNVSGYVSGLLDNPINYAGLPVLTLAGVYLVLEKVRVHRSFAWAIGGLAFGLVLLARYGIEPAIPGFVLLSAPMAYVGASLGDEAYHIVHEPLSWQVIAPLIGAGVAFPLVTGMIDLALRYTAGAG